jgi:hypothetical protein
MIQLVAGKRTDRFAMGGAGIEHQHRAAECVLREDPEHSPLLIVVEVKETVPRQDTVESPSQRYFTHVCHDPLVIGQAAGAERYHFRGAVNTRYVQA